MTMVHLERFRVAIARRLGLSFDESKLGFLAEVLQRRLDATGLDADAYVVALDAHAQRGEIGSLAGELTVPETYFFRSGDQFRALAEVAIPARLRASPAGARLRMLSLGCASGEEPYSLAIAARAFQNTGCEVSIVGVDVNAAVVEKARRGRYSAWALRDTSPEQRQRWFRSQGRDFVLDDSVRAAVRFETRNLLDEDPQFWQAGSYDVVFCRNVIMYFTPEQAQAAVRRIASLLAPGGYLFLGHAETLRGLSTDFHLLHTHGAFYYQRRDPIADGRDGALRQGALVPVESHLRQGSGAQTWVEAIRRSSARVTALTDTAPATSVSRPAPLAPVWDRAGVLDLLRRERFADALALVDALPPEMTADADVLLLRALLLTHAGHIAAAEQACRRLLDVDELSASAHYVLALCRESVGDAADAVQHHQVAAYLDPAFAMPHVHLGLLARRRGAPGEARKNLGRALVLLGREDASRVLLFGGGFSRDALVAVCRTELVACGGTP